MKRGQRKKKRLMARGKCTGSGRINVRDPGGDAKIPQKLYGGDRQDRGQEDALPKGNKREHSLQQGEESKSKGNRIGSCCLLQS